MGFTEKEPDFTNVVQARSLEILCYPALKNMLERLRTYAEQNAQLNHEIPGYVRLAEFNKPGLMREIHAQLWAYLTAHMFQDVGITHVATIQNSGPLLREHLQRYFSKAGYIEIAKAENFPKSGMTGWRLFEGYSFTQQKNVLYGVDEATIRPVDGHGRRVLFFDDALAGGSAYGVVSKLLAGGEGGIVGVSVMFDKAFQQGFDRVSQGVPVFSAVRISETNPDPGHPRKGTITLLSIEDSLRIRTSGN